MAAQNLCWLHLKCYAGSAPELSETPTHNSRNGDYPGHYFVEVLERNRWVEASVSPQRLANVVAVFEQNTGAYLVDAWCFEDEKDTKIKEMCTYLRDLLENDARKLAETLEHLTHLESDLQVPGPGNP